MNLYNLLKNEITLQEFLNYYNANITLIDLPEDINAFVFYYKNIYNIMVNNHLSYYKRKKSIIHELAHIELHQLGQIDNDLFAFKINKFEDEADKYVKIISQLIKTC